MEILFKCLQGGKRYYSVRLNGHELFVGTTDECERFIGIHNCKVAEQHEQERKPQRARAVAIRSYRNLRA